MAQMDLDFAVRPRLHAADPVQSSVVPHNKQVLRSTGRLGRFSIVSTEPHAVLRVVHPCDLLPCQRQLAAAAPRQRRGSHPCIGLPLQMDDAELRIVDGLSNTHNV